MLNDAFYRQVDLLIMILPAVNEEKCFALKGGTAINLFLQDFARLSVDIDLTYLPIEDRETSFTNIESALRRIISRLNMIGINTYLE
jgi:predicted nucleotidyltransferase component of viral defense system